MELARVLDKRSKRKQPKNGENESDGAAKSVQLSKRERTDNELSGRQEKRRKNVAPDTVVDEMQQKQLNSVLGSIF